MSSFAQGKTWLKDCLTLFSRKANLFTLVAFFYMLVLFGLPALIPLKALGLLVVLLVPSIIVIVMSCYRAADQGLEFEIETVVAELKPRFGKLIALGGICMIYSVLVNLLTQGDLDALKVLIDSKADPQTYLSDMMLLATKLMVFLTPILMATWFAPMLIGYHDFSVWKSLKSSIAGCLLAIVPLTVAWLILTIGLAISMVLIGVVVGLISVLVPMLAGILASLVVFIFTLLATALMFSLQYISYRELFANKI